MHILLMASFLAVASAQYHYAPSIPDENTLLSPQPAQQYVEEFNKEFYSFSAPQHEFDDPNAGEEIAHALKKNLRVIFIKSPENKGLEQAALQLAKSASDDRTAIYVLSKQSDIGALVNQLQELKSHTENKPEVHFVKYRTQAEAENAQRTIQAEYDGLPGVSTRNSASAAAVLDFASKSASSFVVKPVVTSTTAAPSTVAPPSTRGYIPPRGSYYSASKRI